jgi:hypothetical protein
MSDTQRCSVPEIGVHWMSLRKTPPPVRISEPPPSTPVEPITKGLAGPQVRAKPQNVIVSIRDLTLARSPRVVRKRVAKARSALGTLDW